MAGIFEGYRDTANSLKNEDDSRKRLAEELGKGEYDSQLADDYYGEYTNGLDKRFADASRARAADFGKRGLGSSGMALGAQSDVAFQAAAQRQAASQKAVQAAKEAKRRSILDEYGIWNDFADENQKLSELSSLDDQADAQRQASLLGIGLGFL